MAGHVSSSLPTPCTLISSEGQGRAPNTARSSGENGPHRRSKTYEVGDLLPPPRTPVQRLRERLEELLRSRTYEATLGLCIATSFGLLVLEVDAGEAGPPPWVEELNITFSLIYALEVGLRIFAARSRFFVSKLNLLDFFVVYTDLGSLLMNATSVQVSFRVGALRGLRVLRLTRALNAFSKWFPQAHLMIKGLKHAMAAAFFGASLMLAVLAIFSVLAVQVIHPVNLRVAETGAYADCSRCPRAFESVRSSLLTFFQQVVIGDNWGDLMLPIMEEAPVTALFFSVVFISVHFAIMNVIMAVIVDIAVRASQEDLAEKVREKEEEFTQAAQDLREICATMDEDGSGDLTEAEISGGFDNNQEFREHLLAMDIKKEDMHVVFGIMDVDNSGTVNYDEFITELFKMKTHDSHTLLVFIKHYVTEIRRDVQEQVRVLKKDILNKIADMEDRQMDCVLDDGPWAGKATEKADPVQHVKNLSNEFAALRVHITREIQDSMKEVLGSKALLLQKGEILQGLELPSAAAATVGGSKVAKLAGLEPIGPSGLEKAVTGKAGAGAPASWTLEPSSNWATRCCGPPPKRR